MKFLRFQICTLLLVTSASIAASAQLPTSHASKPKAAAPAPVPAVSLSKPVAKVNSAILTDQLLTAEVNQNAVVTEVEVREYYKKHPDHFRRGETITLQTISLVIPDDASESKKADIRKRAEELLKQAKAAKDYEAFGMLAEKSSEDDWHVMMGDHKTIFRGNMPPPVEKVAFSMKPGTVSDLIQTENSWCIVRLNAREESKLLPYEEVRAAIRQDMESRRKTAAHDQLESRLRKSATVAAL